MYNRLHKTASSFMYPMHCTAPSIAAVADVWIRPHVIYLFFYL